VESGNRHEQMFAGGERRQLWARDTTLPPDAPLVRIAPGQAKELRPLCKSGQLVCPFPGCSSPPLNTAGGPRRRDHFRHVQRAAQRDHSPETFFHVVGKHLVADWLRQQGAEVEVRIEPRLANDQRPDVLANFPDGSRVAFEVQYAPLSVEAWQRRHDGYRQWGITDYWLFGHLHPQLRRAYGVYRDQGFYQLSQLQQTLEQQRRRVRWLDPDELQLGTRLVETGEAPPNLELCQIGWDALADCRIEDGRLVSPTDRRERTAADEREKRRHPTRWRQLVDAREQAERAHQAMLQHQEQLAARRRLELRQRPQPQRVEVEPAAPVVHLRPQPRRRQPDVKVPVDVPRYPDPERRREVIERTLAQHAGKTLSIRQVLALLAVERISIADFVDEAMALQRDGVVSFAPFSLSAGWVRIPRSRGR
jgi:hypothetical protein